MKEQNLNKELEIAWREAKYVSEQLLKSPSTFSHFDFGQTHYPNGTWSPSPLTGLRPLPMPPIYQRPSGYGWGHTGFGGSFLNPAPFTPRDIARRDYFIDPASPGYGSPWGPYGFGHTGFTQISPLPLTAKYGDPVFSTRGDYLGTYNPYDKSVFNRESYFPNIGTIGPLDDSPRQWLRPSSPFSHFDFGQTHYPSGTWSPSPMTGLSPLPIPPIYQRPSGYGWGHTGYGGSFLQPAPFTPREIVRRDYFMDPASPGYGSPYGPYGFGHTGFNIPTSVYGGWGIDRPETSWERERRYYYNDPLSSGYKSPLGYSSYMPYNDGMPGRPYMNPKPWWVDDSPYGFPGTQIQPNQYVYC